MLVLTRRIDESILIGDDIKIIVVDVCKDKVRIGIEAPREIPIHRFGGPGDRKINDLSQNTTVTQPGEKQ